MQTKPKGDGASRIAPVLEVQLLRAACSDWRLSRGDLGVYAAIAQHANASGECFPGPARIAKLARLSVTNTKGSIRRLEKFGYLHITRPGLRIKNGFALLDAPRVPSRAAAAGKKALDNLMRGHSTGLANIPSRKRRGRFAGDTAAPATRLGVNQQLGIGPRQEDRAFKALSESTWPEDEKQRRDAESLEAWRERMADYGAELPPEDEP